MNTLRLTGLVCHDTRFWMDRASAIYGIASLIPVRPLRESAQSLAQEARENIRSLRLVGPDCPSPPSLTQWGLTVVFLLVVSPRLAIDLCRLFSACVSLRLTVYVDMMHMMAVFFGSFVGAWIWRLW